MGTSEAAAAHDVRAAMQRLMQATLADEQRNHTWTYRAVRPMAVPPRWQALERIVGDCSKGCQYLARWGGGPDPMGLNYGPYGNSATMCHHLQHLDRPSQLQVGDYVTFGVAGSEHAACVLEAGSDPLLWSFGHQGAPNSYRLSYDRRPHQLLRNPVPMYVPTPQDKLRLATGYFAWVAWKLGEGDWASYGPAASKVRPNVARVIGPVWWRRYLAFLANRNKGDKAAGPS